MSRLPCPACGTTSQLSELFEVGAVSPCVCPSCGHGCVVRSFKAMPEEVCVAAWARLLQRGARAHAMSGELIARARSRRLFSENVRKSWLGPQHAGD